MNLIQSRFSSAILLFHIIIYPFQVDADVEFQSKRISSRPTLGNGTLLQDGGGSNDSVLSIDGKPHLLDVSVSLQTSVGKYESTLAPEPKSVSDNASRVSPKVEETAAPSHSHENPGSDGERDDSESTSVISAIESLDEQGFTVNGQQKLNELTSSVDRATASTDDPRAQSGLLPMGGAGSTDVDSESVSSVNGEPRLPDFSVGLQTAAGESQSTATLEPKSLPGNASTVYATAEETSPRDYPQENPGFIDKRGFSGADGELDNDLATKGTAKEERGATVKEQRMQNPANAPTEDPPPQPDLLLLAKLKEIKEMESSASKSDAACQHRVAAIHAVTIVISVMKASCLVQLLWER